MLTSQGREPERISLLKLALQSLSTDEEALESVRPLLNLMLADAEFWAHGQIEAVMRLLPTLRSYLRSRNIEALSDVELRCVTLYHSIVGAIEQCSNFTGKENKTIFPDSKGDRGLEFKILRKVLQSQERLRSASKMMELELGHTATADAQEETVRDALQLCNLMETLASSLTTNMGRPLKFRLVVLRKALANHPSNLKSPRYTELTNEYITNLSGITDSFFPKWDAFCPVIAFDAEKMEVLQSDSPYAEKVDHLLQIARDAERRDDYTKTHQAYISAHDVAKNWLDSVKGSLEEPGALDNFRSVGETLLQFHEQKTGMAYFEGADLTDYLNILSVKYHDYPTVLRLVEAFEEKHPNFEIPNNQERLYDQAITASKHLGIIEKQRQLTKKYQNWALKCSFYKSGGGLTDEAISDPDFAFREIKGDSASPVEWGPNALRLMMRWAGYEWDRDLMSAQDCSTLFGLSLEDSPPTNLAGYLRNLPIKNVSEDIFGPPNEATTTDRFMTQYKKLLDWILLPNRLPSRSARLFALRIFLESRIYRVTERLSDKGLPSTEEAIALHEETKAFNQLQSLEAAENGNNIVELDAKEKVTAIHIALVKVFAVDAIKSGLIHEEDLVSRAADCRELITYYHNSGHRFQEYHHICQLIRLTWQRYLHFKTPPESIMPLVNEADRVFIEIRNSITALSAPEDLVARAELSQDFFHREHHSFALAGRLRAFERYMAQAGSARAKNMPTANLENLAFQSFFAFLHWAFRSKGRGFVEILNLEAGVSQAIAKSKTAIAQVPTASQSTPVILETTSNAENLSSPELINPQSGMMFTKQQIDEMIRDLPDGVVIVDFLDLRYSPTTSYVAMVYRNGQNNLPINIPNMSAAKIDDWVKENLNSEREIYPGQLSGKDAFAQLGKLTPLLHPLIHGLAKVAIQPGETVIFCPTGSLNRVPIHAIPINDKPLIERNPVVYCQSLTILHWLWLKFRNRRQSTKVSKTTLVNPMPDFWSDGKPVQSTERVADLAGKLSADFHHGFNLERKVIAEALEGSTLFYHHGHVSYDSKSAIDSALILNEKAFKVAERVVKPKGSEFITARQIFKIKLCELALAVIIGCGSGIAVISSTDDVLGIPTAFFYAGAGAVVSTLWSIDDEDGAEFSRRFYEAIWEQKRSRHETSAPVSASGGIFDHSVNLARAMQTAVVKIRGDTRRKNRLAPYHWAAFTLNGFWMLPDYVVPEMKSCAPRADSA